MINEGDFLKGIQSDDRREQLETLRDLVAHELSVHRCKSCEAIRMRTSDTAALVLRLQKILEELESIPVKSEEKSEVEKIQERAARKGTGTDDNIITLVGKGAPRRRNGKRRNPEGS